MNIINLDIIFNQMIAIIFLIIVFIILVLSVILLIRSILSKKKLAETTLPDIEGVDNLIVEDPNVDEDDSVSSFFDLDALDSDYTDDMASYKIMQDAQKVQRSNSGSGRSNPFKRL